MDTLTLLCITSAAFTGLTKGSGVLPDGPLNRAVRESVMFNTTLPPSEKPFLSVSWKFGDKNIFTFSGVNIPAPEYENRITFFNSTGSLELRNLTLKDSGEYRVDITQFGEAAKSGRTRLDVYVPVSNVMVTASSTDLVEFNSSVRLSCSSSGSSISFLWMNGSSEVTASDRVQLTDGGANLTIVNVTRYDQGRFRCKAFNPVSDGISEPVNFNISYGPENINLLKSSSQEYFEKGSNINMSCSADSTPPALFKWFLNGELLDDTGPELRLMNIQMNQSGNYNCEAFNSKTLRSEASQPSAVSVLERISGASVTSSTKLPIEENSLNLTCDAAGSVFSRQWMKDGSDLILDANMTLHDNNTVLSFSSLNKKDTGEYSCKVSNPLSSDEAKYSMVVNYGPEHVEIRGPNEIHLNETLILKCSAESTPAATYIWILNGTEIHNSAVFTKNYTELSDSGTYTCRATNNITGRSSSQDHGLTVTVVTDQPSSCLGGCIAGILIAVLVILCGACCGAYYIYMKKKRTNKFSNRNTATRTGGEGQDNAVYSGSQELNYADIHRFQKKDGGTVQLGLQNNTTEYAEVRVNSRPPAASSPPSYDDHLQRVKRPAPQPVNNCPPAASPLPPYDAHLQGTPHNNGAPVYSQVLRDAGNDGSSVEL